MAIEIPEPLATAVTARANALGISPAEYVISVLEEELAPVLAGRSIRLSARYEPGL